MGRLAVAIAENTGHAIRTRDVELAAELARDDDAMDDLHRHIFTVLTAPQWSYGVSCAVDITLLARFYERYADHAVTVARRIVYPCYRSATRPVPTPTTQAILRPR